VQGQVTWLQVTRGGKRTAGVQFLRTKTQSLTLI
jgi:hypothetical protein